MITFEEAPRSRSAIQLDFMDLLIQKAEASEDPKEVMALSLEFDRLMTMRPDLRGYRTIHVRAHERRI